MKKFNCQAAIMSNEKLENLAFGILMMKNKTDKVISIDKVRKRLRAISNTYKKRC